MSKHRDGNGMEPPALTYDARDTLNCEYRTVVAPIGLDLPQTLGWWWADRVAALLIVPYVA